MAANAANGGLQEHLLAEQEVERQPMFPLSGAALIAAARPVATAAFLTTCTALMLAGQGLDETTNRHIKAMMSAVLYAYIPMGLFGLLLAVAVKTNPALVGVSSGFILAHLLLPTVIGAVVNMVKSGESPVVVIVVAIVLLVITVVGWSQMCSYPECRRGAVIAPAPALLPEDQMQPRPADVEDPDQ